MRRVALAAAASCLALAGCGGGGAASQADDPRAGRTLEELWRAPGDDVAVIAGTQTHVPGDVRVSFLVLDAEGAPVLIPTARVLVARGLEEEPFLETTAQLERIGVPGLSEADATHIYVARLKLPEPGTYWLLAEPEGGAPIQALGNVVVAADDPVPDVGEPAPRSRTPTLASVGGDASRITTRRPPDEILLERSVVEALRARVPFVVTFATPKFCESRICAPVVDVVEEVAKRFEGERVWFIHVEVYEGNDPAKGYNRWMREWGLRTEPWTFVVRPDGRIAERYEGAVSVKELEARVATLLETGR
ncbi:MAG: hypothetical protein RMM28_03320 [Thermoleophilia bacterium]|nr:hypothetical protein [Gaiellaceae bacterium]MDW8338151.1 hypothetical protein [Thermoleophilia bacterium]